MEAGYDMIILDWWREETRLIYQRTLSKGDYPSSSSWEVSFTRLPTKETSQKQTKRDPKGLVNLEPECLVE